MPPAPKLAAHSLLRAAPRRVVNPLEKSGVIGITNYIDIGMLLCAAVGDEGGASDQAPASPAAALRGEQLPPPGVNLAAAWQVGRPSHQGRA
eukprot:365277-Chlamydomonas_euryale.AAC.8